MKTTLVIMAAGLGSRYGGIKQLESVGPNGEIIMDYSIHDAIEAGFNKVIFIIRKEIEAEFRKVIGDRIEEIGSKKNVEIEYAFQALDDLPKGYPLPEGRKKPWGTGQAVLSCKDLIHEPFAVINSDDYYGKKAFVQVHDFLINYSPERPREFCLAGFVLENTLSEHGGVTRGVCRVNADGYLTEITETYNIVKTEDGPFEIRESGGTGSYYAIDPKSPVSMNMWGFTPEFLPLLEQGFDDFLAHLGEDENTAEYLIPKYIAKLLLQKKATKVSVKVLNTDEQWFGVTYREDKDAVVAAFEKLVEQGVYDADLFAAWR